jgi:bifunctional non-homologous end joining protein LigD
MSGGHALPRMADWRLGLFGGLATAIVPCSLRARPTASIAMPVSWQALVGLSNAAQFPAAHIALASSDPWRGYFAVQQRVSTDVLNALRQIG